MVMQIKLIVVVVVVVFTLHIDLKPTSRNMVFFSVKNGCSKLLLNFVENAP